MHLTDPTVLAAAVGQRVEALSSLLDGYERDLPPGTCERFLPAVKAIIEALTTFHEQSLSYVEATYRDDPETYNEQVVFYSDYVLQVLANIHEEYLPFLDSSTHQNEYSVLPSILRMVCVFEPDVEVTLIPQFEYCYGFVGFQQFLERVLGILEKHAPTPLSEEWCRLRSRVKSPKITAFLLYPVAERDSALRLTVLVHELVHLIDQSKLLYRDCLPLKLEPSSFSNLVDGMLRSPLGPDEAPGSENKPVTLGSLYSKETVEAKLFKNCNSMVESWLREVIADILSVHALGPAYCFSFIEFLAHGAVKNKYDVQHDKPSFRLSLMFSELEYLGYFQAGDATCNALKECRIGIESLISEEDTYEPIPGVVHKTIEKHLESIQNRLRAFASEYKFSFFASRFADEVPKIVDCLLRGISPVEWYDPNANSFRPSSVAGILNAGWEVYKTSFNKFSALFREDVPATKRLVNLNELLFHALESSEVVRAWNKINT